MATAGSRPYLPSEVAEEMARWNTPDTSPAFRQYREPIEALLARIVAGTVEKFVPSSSPGTFLEIGCGTGQLADWLPRWFAAKTTHIDYSGPTIEELRRERPELQATVADVRQLPYADGQFAAVVGLSVLDGLRQQREARDEIRRVLADGGVLIHWLDMQSGPEALFSHLVQRGEVPLPNFLDNSNLQHVSPAMPGVCLRRSCLMTIWRCRTWRSRGWSISCSAAARPTPRRSPRSCNVSPPEASRQPKRRAPS